MNLQAILKQVEELTAKAERLKSARSSAFTPWAFCPRPLYLARYLLNMPDTGHHGLVRNALLSELKHRPEFLDDPDVQAVLR